MQGYIGDLFSGGVFEITHDHRETYKNVFVIYQKNKKGREAEVEWWVVGVRKRIGLIDSSHSLSTLPFHSRFVMLLSNCEEMVLGEEEGYIQIDERNRDMNIETPLVTECRVSKGQRGRNKGI